LFAQYGERSKSALEVKELLSEEFVTFPLKEAEYVKSVKSGTVPVETVLAFLEQLLDEVDSLLTKSELPEKVDQKLVDNDLYFVCDWALGYRNLKLVPNN
jgi:hypothetical protein